MKIIFMQMLLVGAISIGYVRAESISSNEPGKKKVQTNPVSLQAVDDAGTDLSKDATLTLSSEAPGYCSNKKFLLIDGERIDDGYQNSFAFHTRGNGNDYVIIKLFKAAVINKIYIGNRLGLEDRAKSLAIWVSIDQKEWKKIWQAETIQKEWSIKIDKKIIEARYIKIGLQEKNVLHLNKVRVFGNYKEPLTTKEKKYLQKSEILLENI